MIEIEGVYKTPMKSWPFYICKHIWSPFYFDGISVYHCIKCGKLKERINGVWRYLK